MCATISDLWSRNIDSNKLSTNFVQHKEQRKDICLTSPSEGGSKNTESSVSYRHLKKQYNRVNGGGLDTKPDEQTRQEIDSKTIGVATKDREREKRLTKKKMEGCT